MQISSWIYGPYFLVVFNIERFFNKPWILRDNLKEPRRKLYTWARSKKVTNAMIRYLLNQPESGMLKKKFKEILMSVV